MMSAFDLHRPGSVAEAVALRRRFGPEAAVYAGGTELVLAMRLGMIRYPHLIDIKRIEELREIKVAHGALVIGAAVTHQAIECDPQVRRLIPALAHLEARVANVRVRAMGTLGGNLAFAEPHADPPTLLAALGARLVLAGPQGRRSSLVSESIVGPYETTLRPDELLVAIEVPIPSPDVRASYVKFQILERPSIGVAAVGRIEEGCFTAAPTVVIGAVDDSPRFVPSGALAGVRPDDPEALREIADAASRAVEPVEDLAGTADYKRHLTGVFAGRAIRALATMPSRAPDGMGS